MNTPIENPPSRESFVRAYEEATSGSEEEVVVLYPYRLAIEKFNEILRDDGMVMTYSTDGQRTRMHYSMFVMKED